MFKINSVNWFINSLIKKKFQTVSKTCASGVSYYISSSCFLLCFFLVFFLLCFFSCLFSFMFFSCLFSFMFFFLSFLCFFSCLFICFSFYLFFFLSVCLFVFCPNFFKRWKAKFLKIDITRHLWSAVVLLLWIEHDLEEFPILLMNSSELSIQLHQLYFNQINRKGG